MPKAPRKSSHDKAVRLTASVSNVPQWGARATSFEVSELGCPPKKVQDSVLVRAMRNSSSAKPRREKNESALDSIVGARLGAAGKPTLLCGQGGGCP